MLCLKFLINKKFLSLFFSFFFLILSLSSEAAPEWLFNYRSVYPDSIYVAQRGSGNSSEEARNEALASLARYFKTQVTAKVSTSIKTINSGEEFTEISGTENSVLIESEAELSGVETTQPYFSEELNAWYCVAYLEKNTAYSLFKSEIKRSEQIFLTFFERAQSPRNDSISKRSFYKQAWEKGQDFLSKLEYGRLLNPDVEIEFSESLASFYEIPALMSGETENLTVRLEIYDDYENIIYTAVSKSFEKAGFIVSENGNYSAKVFVSPNIEGDSPFAAFPSLKMELSKSNGNSVFSYQEKVEKKTAAYKINILKKKSYPFLAQLVNENLGTELSKKFGQD